MRPPLSPLSLLPCALVAYLALAALVALTASPQARAAELTLAEAGDAACVLRLSGPIEAGDNARLRALMPQVLARLPSGAASAAEQQVARRICLDSPGGALAEGVALAVTINSHVLGTLVESDGTCLSACAVAFMGGIAYDDPTVPPFPDRVMHPTARLGFHAPSLAVPNGRYSASVVGEAYATALRSVALLQRKMQRLNVPVSLLTMMLETPPEEFTEITTVQQATRLGISVAPIRMPPELTPMVANLACSHAQSLALDAPFAYLDYFTELEPDDSGARFGAQEVLGYGADGLWGCDLWYWPPRDDAEADSYHRLPTSLAGRVELGRYRLLSPPMFWPPEMALRDLSLAADDSAEEATASEVRQTTVADGLCLRADAGPAVTEIFACRQTDREHWTADGDYDLARSYADAEGTALQILPSDQDWEAEGAGQDYHWRLWDLAEATARTEGLGADTADVTCLPEGPSGGFCFLRTN